jgi:hypothetical protein
MGLQGVLTMWQKPIKKTIYTLNVNNYSPEITSMTYPLINQYAQKIGANFHVINSRKYPEFPVTYEKLQIYELGKEHQNDWNIYIDSDALVHPDMPDVTELINKDTILHNGVDFAPIRWKYDSYFQRDGRHMGSCNWFTVASDWCLDLWKPLEDISVHEAINNIFPIQDEILSGITKDHLIDDYTLSRNIAKYGLKALTLLAIMEKFGNPVNGLWHEYQLTEKEKVINMKKVLKTWAMSPKEKELEKEKNNNKIT